MKAEILANFQICISVPLRYLVGDKKRGYALCYCPLRSSHRRNSAKKGVLRNFAKFMGKHLC